MSLVLPVRKTAVCPLPVLLTHCAALEEMVRANILMDAAVWVGGSS